MQRHEIVSNDSADGSRSIRRMVEHFARAADTASPSQGTLVEGARRLLRAHSNASAAIRTVTVRNSAWPILLELFISGEEGGTVFVRHLVVKSGEPVATATRLLDRLVAADLIARMPDPLDRRRVIVRLTPHGRAGIIAMLSEIFAPDEEAAITGAPVPYRRRK